MCANNLDNVFATGHGSASHHDITLHGETRNYENRHLPARRRACALHLPRHHRDRDGEVRAGDGQIRPEQRRRGDLRLRSGRYDGVCQRAVPRTPRHHGRTVHTQGLRFLVVPRHEGQWEERLRKIRRDNGAHKYTVRFKNDQGNVVAWDVVAYIIYDHFKEREIVWFFGRDVTLRIQHENKVKEMNSILDSILNNIPVYLFVKDPGNEFRYLYWNRAFEEYSGIPAERRWGIPIWRSSPTRRTPNISAATISNCCARASA